MKGPLLSDLLRSLSIFNLDIRVIVREKGRNLHIFRVGTDINDCENLYIDIKDPLEEKSGKYQIGVYLAGPYGSTDHIQVLRNIEKGIRTGSRLMKLGFSVFNPFLDYQTSFFEKLEQGEYLGSSLDQVHRQDILYALKGWESSQGTLGEIREAERCGMRIFYEDDYTPEQLAAFLGVR